MADALSDLKKSLESLDPIIEQLDELSVNLDRVSKDLEIARLAQLAERGTATGIDFDDDVPF
jgi:hypothetical protein